MTSTFVITGATGPIGGATATALAVGGARLTLLCRPPAKGTMPPPRHDLWT